MILTIFTPTYNRAYLLPQLFDSLKRQTNQNFVWLIVDDGSTDDTRDLIDNWKSIVSFEIQYVYQENQGMHGAHNTAYENCTTTFNVCIDSDDYMPDNGVETILQELKNLDSKFAGLIGLDQSKETGMIIGTKIPDSMDKVKINELYTKYGVKGDKKLVYRTDIVRRYPKYPLYAGERFVPLDYLYLLIDQDYWLKPVNKVFCIVEYQLDGSTKNILKQYRRHPNGFAFSRISRIRFGSTLKEQFKNAVHLVSSSIFSNKSSWLFKSDKPLLILVAIPFGVILNIYIRIKT